MFSASAMFCPGRGGNVLGDQLNPKRVYSAYAFIEAILVYSELLKVGTRLKDD